MAKTPEELNAELEALVKLESNSRYILVDKKPVPEPSLYKWGAWYQNTANRIVAREKVGDAEVSTVFLALDHNFFMKGRPALFETMIFGGEHDGYQDRYATWDEAEAYHKLIVARLRAGLGPEESE